MMLELGRCMKIRVLVWGAGDIGKFIAKALKQYEECDYHVVAFTDRYQDYSPIFEGYPFCKYDELESVSFDYVVIACNNSNLYEKILNNAIEKLNVTQDNILRWIDFLNSIRKKCIQEKYKNCNDEEMIATLKWLETHELSFQNQYTNTENVYYEVYDDVESGYPYILFQGKRMYLPHEVDYLKKDGKRYVVNAVEDAQYPGSPHLYINGEHTVNEGDVIVDAGTAEGNFTLAHIEKISKAYLFEPDSKWIEPLRLTFLPWSDKIVLITKLLGDLDNEEWATLDSVINEKVDFVKMDIEGSETKAVLGGLDLLRRSNAKLSICAYHRRYDDKQLCFLLEALGYRTSHTNGKQFFLYDEDIDLSLDFRYGVVYGDKK